MNETMKDFITRRKAEIKEQIAALRMELREIRTAESAISGDESTAPKTRNKSSNHPTIKDLIIEVLKTREQGADAKEIIHMIKEQHGKEVSRPSISPQLSRLKSEGKLHLDNKIWTLAVAKSPNKEAPEGASNSCEVAASLNSNASDTGQTQQISVDDLV